MNNTFIEGPIQTGKSTLIRKILKESYGPNLDGVYGFTSQRVTDSDGRLLGFRLAPADAELSITLDEAGVSDISELDNVFKTFAAGCSSVDLSVFENAGVRYLEKALAKAKAGQASTILLDEIGGHELECEAFRIKLYEVLDSEYPCIGVIKSIENTRNMDPSLLQLNQELHDRIGPVIKKEGD